MGDAYNPETAIVEELEALTVEAHQLARKRDEAQSLEERQVLERQLRQVERQIEHLKRRLRG
ncbi:MAG TPA: hypothetical protein VF184_04015 [Phycisphaeraceae bacterium]